MQRCQWVLHDAEIVERFESVLRELSGVDIAYSPAPQDVAKLMLVNTRIRDSYCPVRLHYRKGWKVCRRTDMPGHHEIITASHLGLLHWAMLMNSPKMMVLAAKIINKFYKMAASDDAAENRGVQLCRPWRAVRPGRADAQLEELHSALFLGCYSASLTKRHILGACGFAGWQVVAEVLAIESETIGHKAKEYGDGADITQIFTGIPVALTGKEKGNERINVDEVDGHTNPVVIACQNGHAMVLDSLLRSSELDGLADVTQQTEDGIDAHDCTLLLLRRAEMQQEPSEVMDILEHQLALLQETDPIKQKLKAKNSVFFFQALTALAFVIIAMFLVGIANDGSHYWTIASVRAIVVETEFSAANDITQANGLRWWEDLSDVDEINLIKQWFSEPFCAKIVRPWGNGGHGGEGGGQYEENYFGMWVIIGAMKVSKFDAHNHCINGSAGAPSYFGGLASRSGCFVTEGIEIHRILPHEPMYWSAQTKRRLRTDLPDSLLLHPADFAAPLTTWSNLTDKAYRNKYLNANLSVIVDTDWLSPATRLVSLTFVVYHPNKDVYVVVEVYWEVFEFGEVYPSWRFSAVRIQSPEDSSTGDRVLWWLFRVIVCYLLLLQLYQFIVDLTEAVQRESERKKQRAAGRAGRVLQQLGPQRILHFLHRFLDEWLWQGGDIVDLILLAMAVWTWWCRDLQFELQQYLGGVGLLQPGYKEFDRSFILLARATDSFRYFTGGLILLSWIWFAKIMRRLGSVGDIVFAILATITAREVLTFGVLFTAILLGYWQALYCIFGPRVEGLEDLQGSFLATLRMFLGDMGDEFIGAVENDQDLATIIFVSLMICVVIFFLNVLIAVIGEAYGQAYRPGIYLDWFAKEIYVKQYLLLPPTHHNMCVILGSFGIYLTHLLYSLGVLKPAVEPDANLWDIVSIYGSEQFKSMLRQRDTTSGEVADVAHQIATVVKDNSQITNRIVSNMQCSDQNIAAVFHTVSQMAKNVTESQDRIIAALNEMRIHMGMNPIRADGDAVQGQVQNPNRVITK